MEAVGLLPSADPDRQGWLACAWDKREDFVPDPEGDGYDYADESEEVREGPNGLETKVHPVTLSAFEPMLWGTVSRWNAGQRELTVDDYERLSAFELSAKRAMVAAAFRTMMRPRDGGSNGN